MPTVGGPARQVPACSQGGQWAAGCAPSGAAGTLKKGMAHLQLLHRRVGEGGGVLPLAVALRHAEEGVEVKGLQPAGVRKARRHLQGRGQGQPGEATVEGGGSDGSRGGGSEAGK